MLNLSSLTSQKKLVLVAGLIGIILIGGLGLYVGVYRNGSEQSIVRGLASGLRLPVAKVDGVYVAYGDYIRHVDAQKAYFSSEAAQSIGVAREITDEERAVALERAIRMTAVNSFAKKMGIEVTPLDVERAYDNVVAQASTSSEPGDFENVLSDVLGMTSDEFKRLVVKPALQEDALKQRRLTETQDPLAFDNELQALMQAPATKRYLKFKLEALR